MNCWKCHHLPYKVNMVTIGDTGGAPWSGGLIRQVISLTAPRVEGSNPGRSVFLSYIFIYTYHLC